MAKPTPFRSDSILGNLPEERQAQIAQWIMECTEGDRYEFARAQLASDGVKVSRSALADWFKGWRLRQRIASADSLALKVQDTLKALNIGLTQDQISEAGQIAFQSEALSAENAKEFREMEYLRVTRESARTKAKHDAEKIAISKAKLSQKEREIEMALRKLTLLEKKAAEAAATASDSKLSDAEKAARIREIFKTDAGRAKK